MTEKERNVLGSLMEYAWECWKDVKYSRNEDAGHAQTYALCMIAFQLDRIAKALETKKRPSLLASNRCTSLRWGAALRETMITATFNIVRFIADLDQVRVARGLVWYDIFRDTGVYGITSKSKRRLWQAMSVNTMATLATWASLNVQDYIRQEVSSAR